MARARTNKRSNPPPPVVEPSRPRPPAPPLPDWFSAGAVTSDNRRSVRTYSQLAYRLVGDALAGAYALPVFQRPPVWTREQQILLLDSLVRGWTCGSLLVWEAPSGTNSRPLAGCSTSPDGPTRYLILDGQQRVTALMAAARGELQVRWDGERWGPTGYFDAKMCFQNPVMSDDGWWDFQLSLREHAGDEIWLAALHTWENVHSAVIQVTIVEGDEAAARDAYRRFNSSGTAHLDE